MRKSVLILGLTVCSLAAAGVAYSAARMQPGLWRNSSIMDLGQAMPKLTPQEMAQMKAMGVQIPVAGQPLISEICVTAAQAVMDTPPNLVQGESGCSTQNVRATGNSVSADVVCTGRIKGQGHMETTYSGMTHYQGKYRFQGTSDGQPQNLNVSFDANFVSASCGTVKPVQ